MHILVQLQYWCTEFLMPKLKTCSARTFSGNEIQGQEQN